MKNRISFILVVFLAVFIAGLTSCVHNPGEANHVHSYDVQNTDIKYLVSSADYENSAVYYYSCACGQAGTSTFNYGGTVALSEGLSFKSNGDGTCFVSGIGICTDEKVVVPFTSPDGDTVVAIGELAFYKCTNMVNLMMPDSITSISNLAFKNCTGLENITLPDSITHIGGSAFDGCIKLKNVTLPKDIVSVSAFLFAECTSLEGVIIPEGVTKIGIHAFAGCHNLKSIVIPDSVTTIGNTAFGDCKSLKSVIMGSGVTVIDVCAFYYCESLTEIKITEAVTLIGSNAFANCSSLVSVTFENPNDWWCSRDESAENGTVISFSELADTKAAANYLKSDLAMYYWNRG